MNAYWLMPGRVFASDPNDMRALSRAELQQQAIAHSVASWNYRPTLQDMLGAANYRRPVHVPQGIADWYSLGDELH